MKTRSLHARLIAGAAIWSAGLIAAALAVALFSMAHYPGHGLIIHNGLLALTGAVLATAGLSVIRRGLSPFALLRERLAAVRDGTSARLEGDYPSEVAPLVDDLNRLLEERQRSVDRAVARAGDLAHGLKTPLAVLAQEIDRAGAAGQTELAAAMRHEVERMHRQIASHLAEARATASGRDPAARADVAATARALARTTARLYQDRGLSMTIDVAADTGVRVPVEDLEEMLGNLMDNACKWARSRITISTVVDGTTVVMLVDDDGPGLAEDERKRVLQRGVRADEAAPGSGLGLSIVQNLAEMYGGSIALEHSSEGGLRARLTLPRASA